MKIAVCVSAYQAPRVLAQAVRAYRAMDWYIYAHLDAKADIDAYRAEMGDAAAHVHFIPNRIPVFWGGMSILESQFFMFDAAVKDGADRIVSVTDDTMPIQPLAKIAWTVEQDVDHMLFMDVPPGHPFFSRYWDFTIHDHLATNPRGGGMRPVDDAFHTLARECYDLRLIGKKQLKVASGSAHRAMTTRTVVEVMQIARADPHLWASFKFSAVPDETLLPTIMGNYLSPRPIGACPMFMDFSQGHGPLIYSGFSDLPPDLPSHYLFARKFANESAGACDAAVNRMIAANTSPRAQHKEIMHMNDPKPDERNEPEAPRAPTPEQVAAELALVEGLHDDE